MGWWSKQTKTKNYKYIQRRDPKGITSKIRSLSYCAGENPRKMNYTYIKLIPIVTLC